MRSRPYPILLFVIIVYLGIVNLLAETYYWYWRMRWFDKPMHFLGGVWLAGTALWWRYSRRGVVIPGFWRILGVSLLAALGVGLMWEIFQAILGLEMVGHASRISGTLSDLSFDILGGIASAILVWWQNRMNRIN